MAKLTYFAMASLDGYVNDRDGNFDWAFPSEDVHQFANDLTRPVGTHLYGRRMYEIMAAWETFGGPEEPPVIRDFAEVWRASEKVVYSTTLPAVSTVKTRLERSFDADAVRAMKQAASRDISVAGPGLASHALRAGLVDELQLVTVPYIAGGGTRWLPDDLQMRLELAEERTFSNGSVFTRYRPDR